jgi:hypothetical protein
VTWSRHWNWDQITSKMMICSVCTGTNLVLVCTYLYCEVQKLLTCYHFPGAEAILPPMKTCPRDGCGHAHLSETRRVESRLYTLRRGVLPVFSVSTYCRSTSVLVQICQHSVRINCNSVECSTRYYHDYSVQHASNSNARREYYGGVPEYMHITESSFMERALCVHNEMQMVFSQ